MADKVTGTKPEKTEELTIEELAAKLKVKAWIIRGMMVAYNWGAGKRLTEKEFLAKKDAWLKGPMCKS
ncbi:MAG: hypothetical protein ACM3YE_17220 [Bacteroidota bacterium]